MRYVLVQVPDGTEHTDELFDAVADAAFEWESKYHEERDFDVVVSGASGENADLYAGRTYHSDGGHHYFGESTDIRNTRIHVWDDKKGEIFHRSVLFLSGWKSLGHWKQAVTRVLNRGDDR